MAEKDAHIIKKINPNTGTSTVFAGQVNSSGDTDGVGIAAQFNQPIGIAIDELDNLYVADSQNGKIKKIAPDGTVTTFAGTGKAGHQDGDKDLVRLNTPAAMKYHEGTIYFTEYGSDTVRKLNLYTNEITTIAGTGTTGYIDGPSHKAQFRNPNSLEIDPDGNILVTDRDNHVLRIIRTDGQVRTIAGSYVSGNITGGSKKARFSTPASIINYAPNKYLVADSGNNRIKLISRKVRQAPNQQEFNSSPSIRIISDLSKAKDEKGIVSILEGTFYNLIAASFDKEDGPIDSRIVWISDIQGKVGSGQSFNVNELKVGLHRINVRVQDSKGAVSNASIIIDVQAEQTNDDDDETSDSNGDTSDNIAIQGSVSLEIIDPSQDPKMYRRFRRDGLLFAYAWQAIPTACSDGLSAILSSTETEKKGSAGEVIFNKLSSKLRWQSDDVGIIGQGETINLKGLTPGIHQIKASIGESTNYITVKISKNGKGRKIFSILQDEETAFKKSK